LNPVIEVVLRLPGIGFESSQGLAPSVTAYGSGR
jgi:hypothetical protein